MADVPPLPSLRKHVLAEVYEIQERLGQLITLLETDSKETRARSPLEEWRPDPAVRRGLTCQFALTEGEFERELEQFRLRNMASGNDPVNRDAALKGWLSRLATLNHKPKPPINSPGPSVTMSRDELIASYTKTIESYRKMGRDADADEVALRLEQLETAQ